MKSTQLIFACLAGLLTLISNTPLFAQFPTTPKREMRGVWLTTVSNLDWPVSTQTPAQQKRALISQLDQLQAMNINTVVFQVRSECDAMYVSDLEPWSRYLTGVQGRAPSPLYDPLQFAIDETRRRGIELHAWINPYRAGVNRNATFATNHVSRNGSSFVVTFLNNFWLDPGNPATIAYTNQIVQDIITRYDVDALHMDDYFYPYETSTTNPFPDTASYAAFNPTGLSISNWRRKNTETLVSTLYTNIHATPGKNHVRLGISPFGIYRPNNPPGISGLDSYSQIYIDSRKWLATGIVDYMAPQLYWGRAADGYSSQQDYDALITWWSSTVQNPLSRHVIGGLPAYKVADSSITNPEHLVNMIQSTRSTLKASGNIHFRSGNLLSANTGLGSLLKSGVYSQSNVLVPDSTWLDNSPPEVPNVVLEQTGSAINVYITPVDEEDARWLLVQYYDRSNWQSTVYPGWLRKAVVPDPNATHISVRTVDRSGNMSDVQWIATSSPAQPVPEQKTWTLLQNFESSANGAAQVMFRLPNTSGSTRGIATGSTTTVTNTEWNNRLDPLAGNPGLNSNRLRFTWLVAGEGRVRATTIASNVSPNPQVDFRRGLSLAIKLPAGKLDVSLLLRETSTTGPVGSDGGTTGSIEQTIPIRVNGSASWQYIYVDLPKAALQSFSAGNEQLEGDFGVLEGLLLEAVAGDPTTAIDFYVDDIYQGPEQHPFGEDNYRAELKTIPVFNGKDNWLFN